uniref:Uncharacterized protein n=1 Tax=Pseudonaja textilis TaxID=8673 RepID=A0A670Y3L4_PSETE
MQEDDLNEKGVFVASIMNRVRDLKSKNKNEDNITDELNFTKVSIDTTENFQWSFDILSFFHLNICHLITKLLHF